MSRDAIYLIRVAGGAVALGGALGGLVGAAIAVAVSSENKVLVESNNITAFDTLDDLPEDLRQHPDWPAKKHKGSVIVIPKTVIKDFKFTWTGRMKFRAENDNYSIATEIYKWFWIKKYMRIFNWPI